MIQKQANTLWLLLPKKIKNSKEDKWLIGKGQERVYFNQLAIRASAMRRDMEQRPIEESRKRNNVEATIFHVGYTSINGKSKYRGLIKNQIWANCRCLWVNLVRILHYIAQKCQNPFQNSMDLPFLYIMRATNRFYNVFCNKLAQKFSILGLLFSQKI